jgi:hypothetical protein
LWNSRIAAIRLLVRLSLARGFSSTFCNSAEALVSVAAHGAAASAANARSARYQRGSTGDLSNASEPNGRQVTPSFDGILPAHD